MNRKGQYLAIEAVMTLGIGLSIAIGTISLFTDYRDNVLETGESKQVNAIQSEIISSVQTLEESDNGYTTIELPERVGGSDYKIAFQDGLKVATGDDTYTSELNNLERRYSFTGTADGGSVTIFKNEENITLEAG